MLTNCILLLALFALAWTDMKKQEFPLPLLGVCAAAGVLLCLITKEPSLSGVLGGICVGGVLLLCGLAGRESIGLGDGMMFLVTGIYLGLWRNLMLLFFASLSCAAVGLILVLSKKCARKQRLPFAPFVLVSDVVMLALLI